MAGCRVGRQRLARAASAAAGAGRIASRIAVRRLAATARARCSAPSANTRANTRANTANTREPVVLALLIQQLIQCHGVVLVVLASVGNTFANTPTSVDDFGAYLPPMKAVLQCLKGLRVMMIEDFGDDCFAKTQAQPWPQKYLDRIMAGVSAFALPFWSPAQHVAFLDAFVLSINLGARKVELPRYRLSNGAWLNPEMVEGKATKCWLDQVVDGWWYRASPVRSKTDYDNAKYGSTRMWFKVDSTDPWNLAARMLARERRHPCEPDMRHSCPLLLDPSTGASVSGNTLVTWLNDVKSVFVDASDSELAAFLTWHASRVTLASKLVKLKKPWERIQTLVRWESVESARIYGRAEAEAYHADISAAMAADAAGVKDLPEIDPISALRDIDAALASESDERTEAAAARASEASALRGAQKPAKAQRRTPSSGPATRPPAVPAACPRSPSQSPPLGPASASLALADGALVEVFPSDSWGVSGQTFTIPESVWTLDDADSARLRYVVAGLAFSSGSPCFVVRVERGERLGECYLVGAHVIKSLMNRAMRARAGRRLSSAPSAV